MDEELNTLLPKLFNIAPELSLLTIKTLIETLEFAVEPCARI